MVNMFKVWVYYDFFIREFLFDYRKLEMINVVDFWFVFINCEFYNMYIE